MPGIEKGSREVGAKAVEVEEEHVAMAFDPSRRRRSGAAGNERHRGQGENEGGEGERKSHGSRLTEDPIRVERRIFGFPPSPPSGDNFRLCASGGARNGTKTMTTLVNVNGELGSEKDRLLSPLDQGFLFGASVYETIRTYGGRPFFLERHIKRLRESAQALSIHLDDS
jgi:hypothetical protein